MEAEKYCLTQEFTKTALPWWEEELLADGRHRPLRPCSEIHYDMGPPRPTSATPMQIPCDRPLCRDLNLVFSVRPQPEDAPAAQPSIDTAWA